MAKKKSKLSQLKKVKDEPRYKAIFGYEGEFNKAMVTTIKAMSKEIGDAIGKIAGPKGK